MFWNKDKSEVSFGFNPAILEVPSLPPEIEKFLGEWTKAIEHFLMAYKAGELPLDRAVDWVNQTAYVAIRMRLDRDEQRRRKAEIEAAHIEDRIEGEERLRWETARMKEEILTARLRSIKLVLGDSLEVE